MFITKPRPKKGVLTAPLPKKRRSHAIEEISFDNESRAEYLTGFHKRKVQRQKAAAEVAAEKARKEKIAFRKQLREQRQKEVEEHVQQVNEALRIARLAGGEEDEEEGEEDEEWDGIKDDEEAAPPDFVDHEEEYIDEDKYTTVTVEAVGIDREGMHRLSKKYKSEENEVNGNADGEDEASKDKEGEESDKKKKEWPKKKKKKFRYETKFERQVAAKRQKRK